MLLINTETTLNYRLVLQLDNRYLVPGTCILPHIYISIPGTSTRYQVAAPCVKKASKNYGHDIEWLMAIWDYFELQRGLQQDVQHHQYQYQ